LPKRASEAPELPVRVGVHSRTGEGEVTDDEAGAQSPGRASTWRNIRWIAATPDILLSAWRMIWSIPGSGRRVCTRPR